MRCSSGHCLVLKFQNHVPLAKRNSGRESGPETPGLGQPRAVSCFSAAPHRHAPVAIPGPHRVNALGFLTSAAAVVFDGCRASKRVFCFISHCVSPPPSMKRKIEVGWWLKTNRGTGVRSPGSVLDAVLCVCVSGYACGVWLRSWEG